MEPLAAQRRQGERRRLWDRRSPLARRGSDDRRRRDRRSVARQTTSERRARPDRRASDRRQASDRRSVSRRVGRRRRETPTPYTVEQAAQLKTQFAAPGPVNCPACGGRFTLGPGRRRGAETARRVLCLGCGRAAVVPSSRAARILLIDHHQAVRDSMQAMLASAGHEVVEAADASVALHAYQVVPADVIFLNVLVAGRMGASEFLRRLRRAFPDARVVAVSGRASYTGVDPLAVAQGLGAVRAVRLPLSRDALLRTVEEARL